MTAHSDFINHAKCLVTEKKIRFARLALSGVQGVIQYCCCVFPDFCDTLYA